MGLAEVERVAIAPLQYVPGNPALRAVLGKPGLVKRSGLWCEFGVYKGETLRLLAGERGRARLVGFDSFKGLPRPWTRPDTTQFREGYFACDVPDVPGAELAVGLFHETLPHFDDRGEVLTLLHVDCDIYASAAAVLEWAGPRLIPGSVIVFDELVGYPGFEAHEWRALREAYDRGLRWEWLVAAGEGVAIRVTATNAPPRELRRPTVALGIPHKPRASAERDTSFARLRGWVDRGPSELSVKVFTDVKPNRAWARDMWLWGAGSGAEFFLTLQDDVILMPRFWDVLFAMLTALPRGAILGPSAQHPRIRAQMAPWVRTRAWVVGWAYGLWQDDLRAMLGHDLTGKDADKTEDSFVNAWAASAKRDVWHPVPTPVQHDVTVPTTYKNNTHPATCDWRSVSEETQARMADPAYWRTLDLPPELTIP